MTKQATKKDSQATGEDSGAQPTEQELKNAMILSHIEIILEQLIEAAELLKATAIHLTAIRTHVDKKGKDLDCSV